MPDEALISAPDNLRDSYSQRQKVTQNLLTALKGTPGALTKTARVLRDHAQQGSSIEAGKGNG